MTMSITGRVREMETGGGVPAVRVQAYDADWVHDDLLGESPTDARGRYTIRYERSASGFTDRPDIYLLVKAPDGRTLQSTRRSVLSDVETDVSLDVDISCWKLVQAGLRDPSGLPSEHTRPAAAPEYRRLTLHPARGQDDALLGEIERELASGKASVLELLQSFMQELQHSADSGAPAFAKMAKLFELGLTPKSMNGHHYGVALGLRPDAPHGILSHFDNIVGLLWGAALQDESPWVGKTFRPIDSATLRSLTGAQDKSSAAWLGINHFNRVVGHLTNSVAFHALSFWLELEDAPAKEQRAFACDRCGGHFVSHVAPSVYAGPPRDVFSLNYRWPELGNRPPLAWLIDELVEIAEGLYLGQLLIAGKRLLAAYDAARPPADYGYHHMGYFSLWDERWNREARRLFPFLEIPITAPGMIDAGAPALDGSAKYQTLTCEEPAPAVCDPDVFAQVLGDLEREKTVLHLLKTYSEILQDNLDNSSPYFARLGELFLRGKPVTHLEGFFRGALVSWHSNGLLALFGKNRLNALWRTFAGRFSTWTGKSFEPITAERLSDITDGFELGDIPTFWGANTQALRTMKEREIGRMMELLDLWTERASPDEALKNGYDVKNFFFVAHAAESINEHCPGKRIFQFNYRWPKLRTMVPDCYCIDELVEIAEGLYLGQLMYATDIVRPYDPTVAAKEYRYGMFGYFLLMTEDWHRIRLRIGFDLENT